MNVFIISKLIWKFYLFNTSVSTSAFIQSFYFSFCWVSISQVFAHSLVSSVSPFLWLKESEVTQSCPTLCDPMDCSPPGSSVHGISQAGYWSGLPFPLPGELPDPMVKPSSPALAGTFFTTESPGKPNYHMYCCCCFSCSVMSDSLRPCGLYSSPGSSVHGILQARILEWVAISFSIVF